VVLEWEGRTEDGEKGGERRVKKKNGFYPGFTFQITAAAATLKTDSPTAAWKFKLGPVGRGRCPRVVDVVETQVLRMTGR